MKLKKLAAALLALVLILAFAVSASAEILNGEVYKYVKTNTGTGLYVRSTPSAKDDSNIVDMLPYGTRVRIDGYENNGVWALISFEGCRGCYVYTRYLSDTNPGKYVPPVVPTPTPAPSPAPSGSQISFDTFRHVTPYQAMVSTGSPTGRVYLRWAPGTAYAYMTVCYQGTGLTVLAEGDGWCQVMLNSNGYVGFMSAKYISKI